MGWRVGDTAWFIGHRPNCRTCIGAAHGGVDPLGPEIVRAVSHLAYPTRTCGLKLDCAPVPLCSCGFIKLNPLQADERQALAVELVTGPGCDQQPASANARRPVRPKRSRADARRPAFEGAN